MELVDGVGCKHRGCLAHVTHPCEVCGRVAGFTVAKQETKSMKTVILMGSAYKFSKKSWPRFLTTWRLVGVMPNIERYATKICTNTPNITDWTIDDVEEALSTCE